MGKLNKNQYLLNFRKNLTSQFGEDGIIEKIFEIIPNLNHWCVEFGAWDGKFCSNTYNLLKNLNWRGVLIDGDGKKIKELKENYAGNNNIHIFNRYVETEGDNSLDSLLSQTPIPADFDFLSIDIDGNDYHSWESIKKYQPKVVLIEFNPFIPDDIEFTQVNDSAVQQGNSILSMVILGKRKGYELICINQENAFFVDKKYFSLFKLENNTIMALKHYKAPLQVFQLYDGTLVFHGPQCLFYLNLPVDFNKKLQVFPKVIRSGNFPWREKKANLFLRLLFRIYCRLSRNKEMNLPIDEYCWSWKKEYVSLIDK